MKKINILFLLLPFSLLAQNSDSSSFYFKKGQEEKTTRKFLVASRLFEQAIKHNPSNIDAYMANGYVHLEMKKTDQARVNFLKVHELQPANKEAIKELMLLHFNYRQFNKAIEFANKCIDCHESQRIIGVSLFHTGDYAKAEKMLIAALVKDPKDAEVTYSLARAYLDMELYKKAIPYYEKAISLNATKNAWMYELGLLNYNTGDYKSAVASFKNAAANGYPQGAEFNETLGFCMLYSGDFDNGEKLLAKVIENRPGSKDLLRDLTEVLYKQKQYDRSLAYCQKLLENDPTDMKALYQAGLNFQKKGEKDKGQQMCDKAINEDPSLASLRQEKKMPGM